MADSQGSGSDPPRHPERVVNQYQSLFEVVLKHGYYNLGSERCRDLEVRPTVRTYQVMRNLGMLLRDTGAGFKVLHDSTRRGRLLADPDHLSFGLISRNPHLEGMTDIPRELRPITTSYHVSNTDAHGPTDRVTFGRGPGIDPEQILPIKSDRSPIPIPAGSRASLSDAGGVHSRTFEAGERIDLGLFHEGKYTLEIVDAVGRSTVEQFLLSRSQPPPFAFLQIFMVRPPGRSRGIYPLIRREPGAPGEHRAGQPEPPYTVTPATYVLGFSARSTRWVYHVVTRSPWPPSSELAIEGAARDLADGQPVPSFDGPEIRSLPNGDIAHQFVSAGPIRLQQHSAVNLRLMLRKRRQGSATEERILVERLPVASADQVRPQPAGDEAFSDIYVYV